MASELYLTSTASGNPANQETTSIDTTTTVSTKIQTNGTIITAAKSIVVNRSQNEYNSTSTWEITFDNVEGRHSGEFNINDEINIYADFATEATTLVLNGVIDDVSYGGRATREDLVISGRDFGSILQDVIISPRIFKDTEASEIVLSIMSQNISRITTNNVNTTSTIIDKITFTNKTIEI